MIDIGGAWMPEGKVRRALSRLDGPKLTMNLL